MEKALIYDEKITEGFLPFAITDYFLRYTQEKKQPLLHFWQLDKTFILGMKDTRVNDLSSGIKEIERVGYTPLVRSAGGLGVINDEGVLNISLFLPNPDKKISVDAAYELMTQLMQKAFATEKEPILPFEIPDSYCPGKFDLSIRGKKIAGIAQRRLQEGIAVMAYVSISGNQKQRGEIVKHFYEASLKEDFGKKGYPPVNPQVMKNLSKDTWTVEKAKERFTEIFCQWQEKQPDVTTLKEQLMKKSTQEFLNENLEKMAQRNEMITELRRKNNAL